MDAWDEIAQQWQAYRKRPFPSIVEVLAKSWSGKVLDVGCGNARNLCIFRGELVGVDSSAKMLDYARKNCPKAKFVKASAEHLPFENSSFDFVLCTAVLHLVKDRELAVKEIQRVLKPGGKAIFAVWNKWQWKFVFGPKEQDIPWGGVVRRYYFFNYFELKRLLKEYFSIVQSEGLFGKMLVFVVKKN